MTSTSKVVVITGASQGIGAGLVHGYLERGFKVVANSRSIKPDAFAQDRADDILTVAGDVADPAVAERIIAAAVEKFGRVDTLVNNAGIFLSKPFPEFTPEDYANMMSVNVAGFFYISQHAVRQMLKQGAGHIVNMTTTLVGQPVKGVPAMLTALTKGGLDAATRALAIEYADQGIRVNAVAPGVIQTPMHKPETLAALAGLHPVGRLGQIEEIVDAVLYLENAKFVTGEILHVDGGAHAGHW